MCDKASLNIENFLSDGSLLAQEYGIRANNDPSERNFAILRDALSHMGNTSVYVAAAEAQSRGNNDWGLGVDYLVTGHKSKTVSVLPYRCFNIIN